MNFYKYHALGNTYLILDTADLPTADQIQTLCHPAFGIGADGVLIGTPAPNASPGSSPGSSPNEEPTSFNLRIFNPDGSEAEKSGNGLRIFARYLWDNLDIDDQAFTIHTAGGSVVAQVQDPLQEVTINLGSVHWLAAGQPLSLGELGVSYPYTAVSLGNPHCVIIVPETTAVLAQTHGPHIETHPTFPQRTNVQFVQVLDTHTLKLEIWERGAGYTLSSGSSSGAALAVAHQQGLCDRAVQVQMPGGTMRVSLNEADEVVISGPVTKICEGRLSRDIWPEQTKLQCEW
ncbi:MAG: diaminopimelate epimerase [Anaerolineales bacterium]|nr:diaminopimelate epimerase [Anaerolineales bacterium]